MTLSPFLPVWKALTDLSVNHTLPFFTTYSIRIHDAALPTTGHTDTDDANLLPQYKTLSSSGGGGIKGPRIVEFTCEWLNRRHKGWKRNVSDGITLPNDFKELHGVEETKWVVGEKDSL
ncbi:hypothetical protein CRENBAI_008887 [Crenichthys baileyi]|uniref:Uncharacterized protein n=1 Tax=Crenichthys baileyi TaxID=28760 RepID=A0AAV9QTL4_9TELE